MTSTTGQSRRLQRCALHGLRVFLFVLTIALIRVQHARIGSQRKTRLLATVDLQKLRKFFPEADSVVDSARGNGSGEVLDVSGKSLGYILQTSPESDRLIGFSGPTNTLIAFSPDDRIVGIDILSSGDTRDHVAQVLKDELFLDSFTGLTWKEATTLHDVDSVSGATLTSLAISEAIVQRLSGDRTSLRFPDPLTVGDTQTMFELASRLEQDSVHSSLWHVQDNFGKEIGSILRTSPHADNIVGYQGPTDTLIGFGRDGRVVGIALGKSFDNKEYVAYVREDEYFLNLFNDLVLGELAGFDLEEAEVEGVSGATITSMTVARGLLVAAREHRLALEESTKPRRPLFNWTLRDLGTAIVILAGLTIALTSLRGKKLLRVCFQLLLIVYLGLINGDMLSQAMIVGWAENGVSWSNAGGLVLLTIAAFLMPLTTRRNVYCTHLCPHGAVQQLLKNRLHWRIRLPNRLSRTLRLVPVTLLLWCVIVGMTTLSFSLVDIEPFDAWVFRVAGWATIAIATVGIVASLFVPMAYCRYGCPTGAVLNYLRMNARSDRWSLRDWFAVGLVVVALGFRILSS